MNKTKYAVLGALSMWPMTGYDIRKVLESGIGRFWSESYGQLYPQLRKLSEEGLIRRSEETARGKPRRIMYSLSPAGRAQLREWLARPAVIGTAREEVLLKLFFGSQAEAAVSEEHIRRFKSFHEECLRKCQRVKKSLAASEKTAELTYWMITLLYNVQVSTALVVWCDEALRMLQSQK